MTRLRSPVVPLVMPGLVPGIQASASGMGADGRDEPVHDDGDGLNE